MDGVVLDYYLYVPSLTSMSLFTEIITFGNLEASTRLRYDSNLIGTFPQSQPVLASFGQTGALY